MKAIELCLRYVSPFNEPGLLDIFCGIIIVLVLVLVLVLVRPVLVTDVIKIRRYCDGTNYYFRKKKIDENHIDSIAERFWVFRG